MSNRHVVLGLLESGPLHGYDLLARFQQELSGVWAMDTGQLYRVLAQLEREGLVDMKRVPQERRPDRKVYSLTEAGRAELDAWRRAPVPARRRLSDELLVKLALTPPGYERELLAAIAGQRRAYELYLAELEATVEQAGPYLTLPQRLSCEAGIRHTRTDLEWLDYCERAIRHDLGDAPAEGGADGHE